MYEDLNVSARALDQLLDALALVGGRVNREGRIQYASTELANILKQPPEEVVGQSVTDIVCLGYQDQLRQGLASAIEGRYNSIEACLRMTGAVHGKAIQLNLQPLGVMPQVEAGVLFFVTAGAQPRPLRELGEQVNGFLAALDEHAIVAVADLQGTITYVNDKFCAISKYSREELLGRDHRIVKSGHHEPKFYEAMWSTISAGKTWRGEICNRARDGSVYWVHTTITPILDVNGLPESYISIRADITPLKLSQEREHRLAYYDPLTDLPNRRYLQESLAARQQQQGHTDYAALMLIDFDSFRTVNDVHGHQAGDQFLGVAATRLARLVGVLELHAEVFHLGADEFAVVMDAEGADFASAVAATETVLAVLRKELAQPCSLRTEAGEQSIEVGCTTSAGAVCFTQPLVENKNLLQKVDIALVAAKEQGRNHAVFYDQSLREKVSAKHRLEQNLRRGLALDEFSLAYQPIVDQNRQIVGAEALLRWRNPELGAVSPATFIPLAEETRLIIPIGWWVLERACEQLKQWQVDPSTRHWSLSVNVSARQLKDPSFLGRAMALIAHHGVPASKLCLEITETSLLDDLSPGLLNQLRQMRSGGVQLALDDFGTGFSSLSYLKQLPLSKVKIDQTFVRTLLLDVKDQSITRSILLLADGLCLEVIAEGVETEEQFRYLSSVGCPFYQGYLFGRPMPVHDLVAAFR